MKLSVEHVEDMRFLATANGHTVTVDAAPEDGGGGTAMSAPSLFVAAIGACLLEFVLNSCRLHDMGIEHLSVQMAYDEIPGPRRLDTLRATLNLEPEPSAAAKRRLRKVARRATLVNTLVRAPELNIRFGGDGGGDNANL